MESADTDANPGVDGFGEALQMRLDSIESHRYRQNTKTAVQNFQRFLEDKRDVDSLDDIEVIDCRRWTQFLAGSDDISPSSAQTYYALARATCGWWVRDERLDTNPMEAARVEEPLPTDDGDPDRQYWTEDARDQLLQYVDERAHDALEADDTDASKAFRDRALVYLLADTGVRGAEVCAVIGDDRRNGLRWKDVDLDAGLMRVLGKSRQIEPVSIPEPTAEKLDRYRRLVDAPPEWPVIPTADAATKYRAVRTELEDRGRDPEEIEELLESTDIDDVLRDENVAPPALTTDGARDSLLQPLCEEAGVDVDGDYLKPHGGRRALGDALYGEVSPASAQEVLRHRSVETTHASYRERRTEDLAEDIEQVRYQTDGEDSEK